jgi:Uma2 family endonuclease
MADPTLIPESAAIAGDMLYEVVNGRVVEKPPMGAFEGWTASMLIRLLNASDAVTRLGQVISEVLFQIHPTRNLKRRPDVAFVSFERWPMDHPVPIAEAWEVVPDLAIEVVSRSNPAVEVVVKLNDYFQAGVRAVWVIYPVQRVIYLYRSPTDVRILQPGDDLAGGDVLPGFRVPVQALFGPEVSSA